MHTLKGTATTMGADRLALAAAQAEASLSGGDESAHQHSLLHAVDDAIAETLAGLDLAGQTE